MGRNKIKYGQCAVGTQYTGN